MTTAQVPLPTVSVVIPTRRRLSLVEQSLRELLLDPATAEVVVAVNGREIGDHVLTRWRQLDGRVVTIRVDETCIGDHGERPRDQVVPLTRADVILALDDDVVPRRGLVSAHARWHATKDHLFVLGYMPVVQVTGGRLSGTARIYSESYERACRCFAADPVTVLLGLWGGDYSLRREHWLASLELPRIPAGYQGDREFGLRLRTLGLRPVFDDTLRADHWYQRTLRELLDDARSAGVGHARLEAAYPELAVAAEAFRPRRLIRVLQTVTRSDVGWNIVSLALRALALTAGAAKLNRVERAAIRTIWRLAFYRGIRLGEESDRPA